MARSPLMWSLVGLARRHAAAACPSSPPGDVRRPLTRRQFVSALASLGVAACGHRVPTAPRTPPVAIVGGGIAGLAAAHTLMSAGVPAVIYEASARVGGRMHSHRPGYWDDEQTTEWCGELIDANHQTLLALARRFDLPLTDLQAGQPDGSRPTYVLLGQRYAWERADADFKPVRVALSRDFREVGSATTFAESTPAAVRLDRMSVRDWIDSHRSSPRDGTPSTQNVVRMPTGKRRAASSIQPSVLHLLLTRPSVRRSPRPFHLRRLRSSSWTEGMLDPRLIPEIGVADNRGGCPQPRIPSLVRVRRQYGCPVLKGYFCGVLHLKRSPQALFQLDQPKAFASLLTSTPSTPSTRFEVEGARESPAYLDLGG